MGKGTCNKIKKERKITKKQINESVENKTEKDDDKKERQNKRERKITKNLINESQEEKMVKDDDKKERQKKRERKITKNIINEPQEEKTVKDDNEKERPNRRERKRRRKITKNLIDEPLEEETVKDDDEKENENKNLLEYQQIIENDSKNKSLTKNILTTSMALNLMYLRTDANDGLANCIRVNVKNPNAKYPFAVSADCYNVFSSFFGEIIEEIHGEAQDEINILPEFGIIDQYSKYDLNNINKNRSRVIYTEICVRRNLQNFPFSSTINISERKSVIKQMEEKVRKLILEGREEDVKDSEEIALVPEQWETRIDKIKNDLDECGSMRSYPDDRMTLVFKDTVNVYEGCILNFDDHIQYLASVNDGRIGELFSRIFTILTDESMSDINYSAHPDFGYLTLSPSHIGTGMNIRILAKFPFISRLADANSVISEYDCEVENESKLKKTGLMILTNIRTFNITEENIFNDIIRAYNKLSVLEDELELTTAMAVQDDSMSAENLDKMYKIIKHSNSVTYTKKYLTHAVVKQYHGVKSNFGTTFNNCIRHNVFFPRSLYPRACDANCYMKFSRFFDPIILESNRINCFKHSKKPCFGSTMTDKVYQIHHPNILSYRVRFSRNLEAFPFPMMMSAKDRENVEKIMKKVFEDFPVELEGDYCSMKSMSDSVHYEDIISHRLAPTFAAVDLSAGFYRDWPTNRGIFVCKKKGIYPSIILVILVNVFDHIKVIAIDSRGRHLNICYEKAVNMMKFLNLRLEKYYAQKSHYGFLTSFPSSVGCAMRASALVVLNYLGDKREQLEKECIALQLVYRGSKGRGTVAEQNVFDLSFKKNLNVTEQYVMLMFVQRLKELINIERGFDSRIPIPINDNESNSSENEECDDTDYDQEEDFISDKSKSDNSNLPVVKESKSCCK